MYVLEQQIGAGAAHVAIRTIKVVAFGLLLMVGSTCYASMAKVDAARPSARAAAAAKLFGNYCLEAVPSFTAINQRATSAGFSVFQDRTIAPGTHQKDWLIPSPPDGTPLLLNVISGRSQDGKMDVTVCGVSASGATGQDVQQVLSSNPRLGKPFQTSPAPDGGMMVLWRTRFTETQAGTAGVMLAYNVPGLKVVVINLIFKQPR